MCRFELFCGILLCAAPGTAQERGGYMGMGVTSVTAEFAQRANLPDTRGARVGNLAPGGPGDSSGIMIDDVIRELNGIAVAGPDDLVQRVRALPAGSVIEIRYLRRGREHQAKVKLGARPAGLDPGMPGGDTGQFSPPRQQRQQQDRARPPAQQPAPARGGTIRLRTTPIIDKLDLGRNAYYLLVPVGWELDGGIIWTMNQPSMPAKVHARVFNPHGAEQVGFIPLITFTWGPAIQQFYRPGQVNTGIEVQPTIADPLQFIMAVVVPRQRPDLAGAQVVQREELPRAAQAALEATLANHPELRGRVHYRAARVRFAYMLQGRPVEEDIYSINYVTYSAIGSSSALLWGSELVRTSRAEKGSLDTQYPLFQAVNSSLRPDLNWYNRYEQVRQILVRGEIQRSNQTVALSRYIARTNDQVTAMIRRSYEQRQQALDRVNANWDQAIRGVNQYQNPWSGGSVQLPSGYNYAWANAFGEYILSTDPRYNPNVGSSQDWKPMAK